MNLMINYKPKFPNFNSQPAELFENLMTKQIPHFPYFRQNTFLSSWKEFFELQVP